MAGLQGINVNSIIERVKEILLKPEPTWQKIKEETTQPADLIMNFALPLAVVSAICGFIGLCIVGVSLPIVGTIRFPIFSTLISQIVMVALQMGMFFALAQIFVMLAPKFEGTTDLHSAMKLAVYSAAPGLVGSFLSIIPALTPLGALVALYGIYVLFLGIPIMTTVPTEKRLVYFLSCVGCAIVAAAVAAAVAGLFLSAS